MIRFLSVMFLLIIYSSIRPQTPVGTYSLGAGIHYPRFMSITSGSISENSNYGGFISLQRKTSEHLSLRLSGTFDHLETNYSRNPGDVPHKVNIFSGSLDALYEVFPCEILSPYVSGGFGFSNFTSRNSRTAELNKSHWGYQMNIGFGLEYKLTNSISLKSEAIYVTSSNNKVDGNMNVNDKKGLFRTNGDTYLTVDLGFLWSFSMGDDFAYCEECPDGIREIFKIDTLIAQVPVEVIRESVDTVYVERPVLFTVNFDFDKSDLHPEAIPILEHTIAVLQHYKDIQLRIAGHTDSRGTDEYNIRLSERRAKTVYDYLVSRGIDKGRLNIAAFGEKISIRDNDTDTGRAFNRRVEFQIEEKSLTAIK